MEQRDKKGRFTKNSRNGINTEFKKGLVPWNKGGKGLQVSWNKGKKLSFAHIHNLKIAHIGKKPTIETRKRMSQAHLGHPVSEKTRELLRIKKLGDKSHWWKGGITASTRLARRKFYKIIRNKVLERDNYTCQICGANKFLQADHIKSWSEHVESRFDINNCRTVCRKCHYKITYGKPMPDDSKWANFK